MKTKTKTPSTAAGATHRPKARVMWADPDRHCFSDVPHTSMVNRSDGSFTNMTDPVLVLPLPLPAARKLRDFANLSEEERVLAVAKEMDPYNWDAYLNDARAVLRLIGMYGC